MLRDVLGMILGPRQRLWLCLSQDHLHILKGKLLGVPVIDTPKGTAQAEASMDLRRHGGFPGVITALVFDTTPATVEYIGEWPSFWSNSLTGRFLPGLQTPTF
ncbi:hypothetical protein GWK47_031368 [Chionoecetes opilio]|uniref:Uncharacterized protein n=1 Tax=Chionoecetes opilio TaxID=41210 RepID=A0A8J4YL27_CHIOP|nr:hypothetical protein GWK47_031368 [Chionoecetes opilio]